MSLVAGVFIASLLGSVHCAAMCGAFVCNYVGSRSDVGTGGAPHAAYHGGRLVSYAMLGAVAGWIGNGVEWMGNLAGVQRAAAIAAGALMILWAMSAIASAAGIRVPGGAPAWMPRALGAAVARVKSARPVPRAAAIGLLTTLLPCGWLYVFVATAAATGNAAAGAGVMTVFWLGTVPALMAVAFGARRALGPLGRRLPLASAVLVLVLGALAVAGRVRPPLAGGAPPSMVESHHAH